MAGMFADALDGIRSSLDGGRPAQFTTNNSSRRSFDEGRPLGVQDEHIPTTYYNNRAPSDPSHQVLRASSSHGELTTLETESSPDGAPVQTHKAVLSTFRPEPASKPRRSESDDLGDQPDVFTRGETRTSSSFEVSNEEHDGYKATNYYQTASKLNQDPPQMRNSSSLLDMQNAS